MAVSGWSRSSPDIKRVVNDQGQAGEFSLLPGGAWTYVNLATQNSASSALPFDPNYGIYELFAYLLKQGQTLNKATLYKECWYQGEKYTISDGRIIHEALFKPDNHALRWIKIWGSFLQETSHFGRQYRNRPGRTPSQASGRYPQPDGADNAID